MTMRLDIFCISDVGCIRSGNQDMAGAGLQLIRDSQTSLIQNLEPGSNFFLLVADGMGGHQHGELASSYTLEELRAVIYDRGRDWSRPEAVLSEEIERIGTELNLKSVGMQLEKAMGCTLTGFVWAGGKVLLVNVGDSRSYRMRGGILRQLTRDQTIHERDMVPFPRGKAIYSCIGGGISPETEIQDYSEKLLPGDRLLICSDGLTDMVSENDIEVFLSQGQAAQAGSLLLEAAKAAGGTDNISIIVADLVSEGDTLAEDTIQAEDTAAQESCAAPELLPGNSSAELTDTEDMSEENRSDSMPDPDMKESRETCE